MSKQRVTQRVKKRFTSEVNIIDFQPYLPQKKQRVQLSPRNANQELYVRKLQDDAKSIKLEKGIFITSPIFNIGSFALLIVLSGLYAFFWSHLFFIKTNK